MGRNELQTWHMGSKRQPRNEEKWARPVIDKLNESIQVQQGLFVERRGDEEQLKKDWTEGKKNNAKGQ